MVLLVPREFPALMVSLDLPVLPDPLALLDLLDLPALPDPSALPERFIKESQLSVKMRFLVKPPRYGY